MGCEDETLMNVRIVSRRTSVALMALVSLGATACGSAVTAAEAPAHPGSQATAPRADVFMRSVISRDGALGWQQLCTDVQRRLSRDELRSQADAQRTSEESRGLRLSAVPVGVRPLSQGGEAHLYLVTAVGPSRQPEQRTYVVRTGPGGCVEDVGAA
jgi:hypothetical protein